MQKNLICEERLPRMEGRLQISEDESITLFPDTPGGHEENFQKIRLVNCHLAKAILW
jgi:hypothetical protein